EIRTFTLALAGGGVAVGVSAGVDVVNATTEASIGDSAKVNISHGGAGSGQNVLVGAGDGVYHLSVSGGVGGGGVAVGPEVGPSVGVNVVTNTTTAEIGNSAQVTAKNDVIVAAGAKEDFVMIGFGIAGGFVGVGGAVGVLSVTNTTTAHIGDFTTVRADGDV